MIWLVLYLIGLLLASVVYFNFILKKCKVFKVCNIPLGIFAMALSWLSVVTLLYVEHEEKILYRKRKN